MKKAIVGFVMAVDEVEGSFKLNQHKSDADVSAVSTALSHQRHAGAQEIAIPDAGDAADSRDG